MKLLAKMSISSLLLIGGCHLLMTGSPVPLWHIEDLDNPQSVDSVTADGLILHDGRRVPLPYIDVVPADHSVFHKALKDGVEVEPDGEVIGLLEVSRICGNDPVVYRKLRVNLTDLAGVLNPSGLDADTFSPDVLDFIEKNLGVRTESVRSDAYLISKMRRLRREIEFSTETKTDESTETN